VVLAHRGRNRHPVGQALTEIGDQRLDRGDAAHF
jgi:hypothetical protein